MAHDQQPHRTTVSSKLKQTSVSKYVTQYFDQALLLTEI